MIALYKIPLVAWENGIWMIAVFAAVVVILIGAVLAMMNSGRKQ